MERTIKNAVLLPTVLAVLASVPVTVVSTMAGFALVLFLPGRLLLRWLGVQGHWSAAGRTVLSIAVSWAVVPFFLNPIWHLTNNRWVVLGFVWGAVVVLGWFGGPDRSAKPLAVDGGSPFFANRSAVLFAVVVSLFLLAAAVLPYWPTELFGYPVPAKMHDFIKHHAVLDSLVRRPLPIGNVFYARGAAEPVYYYHYFYLIPATVRLWTGLSLSIEMAFGLSSALVAVSTAGMVYAIAKRFTGSESSAMLSAALVTVVGAFDLFLYLPTMFERGRPLVMIDHWAHHPYIVHNVLFQMMWSPQNVLGVLVVLVGVYLLSAGGLRGGWFVWGPVLGAAVVGSSVWVAMGALPALAGWALTTRRRLLPIVAVGCLMVAVCLPQLSGYVQSASHSGRGLTINWPANANGTLGKWVAPGALANLLDLPSMLARDFGAKALLLMLVPLASWRRMWRDDGLRCLCVIGVVALVVSAVVRVELEHNDLRHKMLLLSMVFAAIMAAGAVDPDRAAGRWWNPLGWRPRAGRFRRLSGVFMFVVILAGGANEIYEAPLTACRRYVEDYLDERGLDESGRRELNAERAALRFMRYELPADAVVQAAGTEKRARLAQVIRRQIGVMAPWDDIAVFAPVDQREYLLCVDELLGTLRSGESAYRTRAVLRKYLVTHIFIGRVEREAWGHLERFDDRRYFEDVFERDGIRVVRPVAEGAL